jgi:hypothetical protein
MGKRKKKKGSMNSQVGNTISQVDNHWYDDDEIIALLKHYIGNNPEVAYLDPMLVTDWGDIHNTLKDNLRDYHIERTRSQQRGETIKNKVIMPVNLGHGHWVLVYVIYPENVRELSEIYYFDSKGDPLPGNLRDVLLSEGVFHGCNITNVGQHIQFDDYNCGPWIVEVARTIANNGAIPEQGYDINNARIEHGKVLNSIPCPHKSSQNQKKSKQKEKNTAQQSIDVESEIPRKSKVFQESIDKIAEACLKIIQEIKEIHQLGRERCLNDDNLRRALIMRCIRLGEALTFFREENPLLSEIQIPTDDPKRNLPARCAFVLRNEMLHEYPYEYQQNNEKENKQRFDIMFDFLNTSLDTVEERLKIIKNKNLTNEMCHNPGKPGDPKPFDLAKVSRGYDAANQEITAFLQFLKSQRIDISSDIEETVINEINKLLTQALFRDVCCYYLLNIYQMLITADNIAVQNQDFFNNELDENYFSKMDYVTKTLYDNIRTLRKNLAHFRDEEVDFSEFYEQMMCLINTQEYYLKFFLKDYPLQQKHVQPKHLASSSKKHPRFDEERSLGTTNLSSTYAQLGSSLIPASYGPPPKKDKKGINLVDPKIEIIKKQINTLLKILQNCFARIAEQYQAARTTNYFGLEPSQGHYNTGDCLFAAAQIHISNINDDQTLRQAVVDYIGTQPELLEKIKAGIGQETLRTSHGTVYYDSVEDYLTLMGQPQTWGTNIEVVTLATMLGRPLVVLTPGNQYDMIFDQTAVPGRAPIFLEYTNGHYRPLTIPPGQDARQIYINIKEAIATHEERLKVSETMSTPGSTLSTSSQSDSNTLSDDQGSDPSSKPSFLSGRR